MNLFDRKVMRQIVLEEGADEIDEPYSRGKSRQNGRVSRSSQRSELGEYASIGEEDD
jgi:hypothetical protein